MKNQITFLRKKMMKSVIFVLLCSIVMTSLHAQTVLPNVRVNTTDYLDVSAESGAKTIAVLDNSIYAVWEGESSADVLNIYFAKSIDGGLTFSNDLIVYQGPTSTIHSLPSISVAQNGNIYIVWNAVTNNEEYNVWFSKSTDGGNTFQTPIEITSNNNSFLPSVGSFNNNVYIFYTDVGNYPLADYYFVRSTNNGDSFEAPIQINDAACLGNIEFDGTCTLTVDTSGNIYLAWIDGRRVTGNGDIYFAKSTDNGQSFSANIMVNDINQSGVDAIQKEPFIAVDDANNVYVSFIDKRLGNEWTDERLYLAKSINGGTSFAPETLLAGMDVTVTDYNIEATPSGKLCVALCTHISPNWGAWLLESTDGGTVFSTPVALSDTFDFEYYDIRIVLSANEEVCALWLDNSEGFANVYFARTDADAGISEIELGNISLYPNPTNGIFTIETPNTNNEINIYNLQGQLIYSKLWETADINLDLEIPQGLYLVTVISNNKTYSQKIIVK